MMIINTYKITILLQYILCSFQELVSRARLLADLKKGRSLARETIQEHEPPDPSSVLQHRHTQNELSNYNQIHGRTVMTTYDVMVIIVNDLVST